MLLDELAAGTSAEVLRRLTQQWLEHPAVHRRFEPVWPLVIELASHPDLEIRGQAAQLAARGGKLTSQVVEALAEQLEPDGRVRLDTEELLGLIAQIGEPLRVLGPSIRPLLESSKIGCGPRRPPSRSRLVTRR